ncbi:expressed unknown protein [Seminavis robusta]|uniref:Uncharacterized protein n=1 Tax=Seminavis robusta TaxID=568900 RepID=A0A9N8HHT0_9STRA|nr:expressed unknown protein [Seminavis robusta]|eukprot:Sro554_g165481.1  (178) ;mRNA; r:17970-18503
MVSLLDLIFYIVFCAATPPIIFIVAIVTSHEHQNWNANESRKTTKWNVYAGIVLAIGRIVYLVLLFFAMIYIGMVSYIFHDNCFLVFRHFHLQDTNLSIFKSTLFVLMVVKGGFSLRAQKYSARNPLRALAAAWIVGYIWVSLEWSWSGWFADSAYLDAEHHANLNNLLAKWAPHSN